MQIVVAMRVSFSYEISVPSVSDEQTLLKMLHRVVTTRKSQVATSSVVHFTQASIGNPKLTIILHAEPFSKVVDDR